MSSYLVLARKYRPKQFSDIVGQQSVVRTLVNAIKLKRTHQAYVFSGSRGIGKTSIARIFSKALRCPNVVEKEDGLLYSCDHCPDCIEIAAGNSVNVLEIDGASNNGVDSIREIRENAKFLPSSGLYKIFIIDEVHMLSTAAFNALLKVLEEPPEHIVFIFATTESHKIPDTILGRCQRFDFKRVTVAEIIYQTKKILGEEKIEAEEAALNLIARSAEGSMRDALSILDQVISFSGMKVTAQAVRDSIGLIGTEMVYALLKNILERDAKSALQVVQTAFNQGVDLRVLLKVLIEMLHTLILMQVGIEKPETHFNDDELKLISRLSTARVLEENELIFQVFHHGLDLLSRAAQPKLIFDLLVIKTALAEALFEVGSAGANQPSEPRRSLRPEVANPAQNSVSHSPSVNSGGGAPIVNVAPVTPARTSHQTLDPNLEASVNASFQAPASVQVSVTAAETPAARPMTVQKAPIANAVQSLNATFPSPPKPVVKEVVVDAPVRSTGARTWEGFIEECFAIRPVLAILLESVVEYTVPTEAGGVLRLGFREKDKSKVDQLAMKTFKEQTIMGFNAYFGFKPAIETFYSTQQGESVAEKTERQLNETKQARLAAIHNNVVVQEARSLFGSELTHIELLDKDL